MFNVYEELDSTRGSYRINGLDMNVRTNSTSNDNHHNISKFNINVNVGDFFTSHSLIELPSTSKVHNAMRIILSLELPQNRQIISIDPIFWSSINSVVAI